MAELRLLRNTCVRSAFASRASGGVAPCEGAVPVPRCGWGRLIASVHLSGGNAKGFALSFPEAE
jgi:hypothetical protein